MRKPDSEFVRGLKAALEIARMGEPGLNAHWVACVIAARIARERRKKGARRG